MSELSRQPPPLRPRRHARPGHAPLAAVMRGDAVDSVHTGSIAVVDRHGQLLYAAGDPALPDDDAQRAEAVPGDAVRRRRRHRALRLLRRADRAALREPFGRAAPRRGRGRHAGQGGQHRGRPAVRHARPRVLRATRRGPAAAALFAAREQLLRQAQRHARVLRRNAACRKQTYLDYDHPLQQAIRARGRAFHVDAGSGSRRRHRRLLRAELCGAARRPGARLRAARGPARRRRLRSGAAGSWPTR